MTRILTFITVICIAIVSNTFTTAYDTSDRTFHFGFKKSTNGKSPSINEEGFKSIIKKHRAIFLGDPNKKYIYLTFDNGYENGLSIPILDTLKMKKVPAIFFVTGHYVKTQPKLLRRMTKEGHLIGNHSWSHADMTNISNKQIHLELNRLKEAVTSATGMKNMPYFRPPRGIFNDRTLAFTKKEGYTSVFWSAAYKDWDVHAQRGAKYAYDQMMRQLHPGAIILLHSISKDNADALGDIIDGARQQGYEFARLDQLNLNEIHLDRSS